jgi:HEAT repeat protein
MLLDIIWQGTIVLSLSSIALLIALYVRRLFIQAAEARLEQRRKALKAKVVAYISAEEPQAWRDTKLSVVDERILLGITSELLQNLTGVMRTRILSLLNTVINIERMLNLMRKGAPSDRAKVAARLFWSQDASVHQALHHALHDRDPEVIIAAANSLIAAGQHIDLGLLMSLMKARDMMDHRAARDLMRRLIPKNLAATLSLLTGDEDDIVVLTLDSLGSMIDTELISPLFHLAIQHRNSDVRAAAVRAIGNAGAKSAELIINETLDDQAWEVRVQAAVAVGRLKLTELAPKLAEGLDSDNWWIQWRSAQALVKLGPIGERLLKQVPFDSKAALLADVALAEVHSS